MLNIKSCKYVCCKLKCVPTGFTVDTRQYLWNNCELEVISFNLTTASINTEVNRSSINCTCHYSIDIIAVPIANTVVVLKQFRQQPVSRRAVLLYHQVKSIANLHVACGVIMKSNMYVYQHLKGFLSFNMAVLVHLCTYIY